MPTIVVIDDDFGVREIISKILHLSGYEVFTFEDARPALDELDFSKVDLLIIDFHMPMSGDEAIKELNKRGIHLPIILMAGFIDAVSISSLKSLGVSYFLEKPMHIKELIVMVENALGGNTGG